jgi:hypothetical protein
MAVLAPMPKARVIIAIKENPGYFSNIRAAYRRSRSSDVTSSPLFQSGNRRREYYNACLGLEMLAEIQNILSASLSAILRSIEMGAKSHFYYFLIG